MKWQNWRRSENVEDYTDPNKPVNNPIAACVITIAEVCKLIASALAKDAGRDDIGRKT